MKAGFRVIRAIIPVASFLVLISLVIFVPPNSREIIILFIFGSGLFIHLLFNLLLKSRIKNNTIKRLLLIYLPLTIVQILYFMWQEIYNIEFFLYGALVLFLLELSIRLIFV
jgi:hypothetical protein